MPASKKPKPNASLPRRAKPSVPEEKIDAEGGGLGLDSEVGDKEKKEDKKEKDEKETKLQSDQEAEAKVARAMLLCNPQDDAFKRGNDRALILNRQRLHVAMTAIHASLGHHGLRLLALHVKLPKTVLQARFAR